VLILLRRADQRTAILKKKGKRRVTFPGSAKRLGITFHHKTSCKKMEPILFPIRAMRLFLFAVLFILAALPAALRAQAQATLSIQGILKKTSGIAVEDDNYQITFKLYTTPTAGTAIWSESQPDVEVSSGIYSAVLGTINPLNVPFDQLYYLGVTIAPGAEMIPRVLLTSAPYALSLIGVNNKFPSSGKVVADSIQVNGGVLARGGAPGLNGVSRNGYAFSGNSGDKDSGLFSTGDGKVSLYANNTEVVAATSTGVLATGNLGVSGTFSAGGVAITNNGTVSYNGKNDWRLVHEDNLTPPGGANGWQVYNPLSGQNNGWNNPGSAGAAPIQGNATNFAGLYMYPTDNNQVLKKMYDLAAAGTFSYIKVKFKYYFFDTWGFGDDDRAWAAFADGVNGSQMRVSWDYIPSTLNGTGEFTNEFNTANNFDGTGGTDRSDFTTNGEMTAFRNGTSFWLYFGAALDQGTDDESFGVGMIEIWVK
jgi:hypothetical protein